MVQAPKSFTDSVAVLELFIESVGFEMWHLELITGLVVLISSCRYLLLKTWQDFAESSEATNQQVLTSLQLLDYIVVAFLPRISEELLFRGVLLPVFGFDWKSVLLVASVFGVLHLGSGRKYSFVVCKQSGWRDSVAIHLKLIREVVRQTICLIFNDDSL